MDTLSPEIEQEIERRFSEGRYRTVEDLLRHALNALDNAQDTALHLLELELLKGLEGDDIEMTDEDWGEIRREGRARFEAKRGR